jgi:hypothetical protein
LLLATDCSSGPADGEPPNTNYLFLGNYVDRGSHGVETISLLLALKVAFPKRIHLLRGNHECRQTTQVYGFYDECMSKYRDKDVWKAFAQVFDALPLAAVVNEKVYQVVFRGRGQGVAAHLL